MNYVRLVLSVVAAFVLFFVIDFAVHGILLQQMYLDTADLWRPQAEMMEYMPLSTGMQFGLAALVTAGYVLLSQDYGWKAGLKYGAIIGLILGFAQASIYPYMPIPLAMAGAWFAATLFEITLIGVVVGLIYKPVS